MIPIHTRYPPTNTAGRPPTLLNRPLRKYVASWEIWQDCGPWKSGLSCIVPREIHTSPTVLCTMLLLPFQKSPFHELFFLSAPRRWARMESCEASTTKKYTFDVGIPCTLCFCAPFSPSCAVRYVYTCIHVRVFSYFLPSQVQILTVLGSLGHIYLYLDLFVLVSCHCSFGTHLFVFGFVCACFLPLQFCDKVSFHFCIFLHVHFAAALCIWRWNHGRWRLPMCAAETTTSALTPPSVPWRGVRSFSTSVTGYCLSIVLLLPTQSSCSCHRFYGRQLNDGGQVPTLIAPMNPAAEQLGYFSFLFTYLPP